MQVSAILSKKLPITLPLANIIFILYSIISAYTINCFTHAHNYKFGILATGDGSFLILWSGFSEPKNVQTA